MALPLAPVLFPDIEGPEFVKADEVAAVAQTVLAKHGKAGGVARLYPIAQALDGAEFSIAYLFNAKPFDPFKDEVSHDAAGKCLKAPKLWQNVTGIDVAIWLREAFWREWPDDVREAAVLHELLHVDVSHDDKGFLHLAVRKHDLEDFVDVARIYGPLFGYGEGGAPAYVRAANTWADRHREPPTPLRTVEPDETPVEEATRMLRDVVVGMVEQALDRDEGADA